MMFTPLHHQRSSSSLSSRRKRLSLSSIISLFVMMMIIRDIINFGSVDHFRMIKNSTTTTTDSSTLAEADNLVKDGDQYNDYDYIQRRSASNLTVQVRYVLPISNDGDGQTSSMVMIARDDVPDYWQTKFQLRKDCPHYHDAEKGTEFDTMQQPEAQGGGPPVLYSSTYHDRSGAIILRMIKSYSYAYKFGFPYGGSIERVHEHEWEHHKYIHEALLRSIGMDHVLHFIMPPSPQNNPIAYKNAVHHGESCIRSAKLSMDFVQHLKSLPILDEERNMMMQGTRTTVTTRNTTTTQPELQNPPLRVAVHIRRGDAHPCVDYVPDSGNRYAPKDVIKDRYTPNEYYLRVLDEHVLINNSDDDTANNNNDVEVFIFSESDSFESFDVFIERGYTVRLDGPVTDAWSYMVRADVVVTSPNSYFSFIPSLLNRHGKIYVYDEQTWGMRRNPSFIPINPQIRLDSDMLLDELIEERCETWLHENPWHNTTITEW